MQEGRIKWRAARGSRKQRVDFLPFSLRANGSAQRSPAQVRADRENESGGCTSLCFDSLTRSDHFYQCAAVAPSPSPSSLCSIRFFSSSTLVLFPHQSQRSLAPASLVLFIEFDRAGIDSGNNTTVGLAVGSVAPPFAPSSLCSLSLSESACLLISLPRCFGILGFIATISLSYRGNSATLY